MLLAMSREAEKSLNQPLADVEMAVKLLCLLDRESRGMLPRHASSTHEQRQHPMPDDPGRDIDLGRDPGRHYPPLNSASTR